MKRNDIGDSYLLWLLERFLVHPRKRTITPTYAGKHSAQPSRMPGRQPLEMPDRYRFHSTRPAPWEASQCGVERRPPVQGRSELQAHDTTVIQRLAVEVREGLGRSPGPRDPSPASFLGTPQDSGQLPYVMPTPCFRPSVSLLSCDLLDHEY